MRRFARCVALAATVLLVAAPLVVPSVASAQMREFTGQIKSIDKKKFIVDNGMGDKLKFVPADDVAVSGEKEDYKKLRSRDWVTISWKLIDNPRKAYKIIVLPPRDEAGEDL